MLKSFDQILAEKLQDFPSENSDLLISHSLSNFDMTSKVLELGQQKTYHFVSLLLQKKVYKTQQRSPLKPNLLNESQKISLEFINNFLKPTQKIVYTFSEKQLKKAFRTAALQTHPDQGGVHENFLQLKNHFKNLMDSLDLSARFK